MSLWAVGISLAIFLVGYMAWDYFRFYGKW